jgi:hypothetical protein
MSSKVVKFPGGGGAIIHTLRRAKKCFYCNEPSTRLCDGPSRTAPSILSKTCDRPLCEMHTTPGRFPNMDYCPEHSHLAK